MTYVVADLTHVLRYNRLFASLVEFVCDRNREAGAEHLSGEEIHRTLNRRELSREEERGL